MVSKSQDQDTEHDAEADVEFQHAVPREQYNRVSALTEHLFQPYTVEGGSIRLAGCSLEDQPILRFAYEKPLGEASTEDAELRFVTPDGEPVPDEMVAWIADSVPISGKPPALSAATVERWKALGTQWADSPDRGTGKLLTATVIWCKYAQGKLSFEFGSTSSELPFHGWSRDFATGAVIPPPFRCPITKKESYHVVLSDDGKVTVPAALAHCSESGQRVVDDSLETCPVSGRRALPEFFVDCPVTSERVLRSALARCTACRQLVSPNAIEDGRCEVCRSLQTVPADDPRVVAACQQFPKLSATKHWRIGESGAATVMIARQLLRKTLLVFAKSDGELLHHAVAPRWSNHWNTPSS